MNVAQEGRDGQREKPRRGRPPKRREPAGESSSSSKRRKVHIFLGHAWIFCLTFFVFYFIFPFFRDKEWGSQARMRFWGSSGWFVLSCLQRGRPSRSPEADEITPEIENVQNEDQNANPTNPSSDSRFSFTSRKRNDEWY